MYQDIRRICREGEGEGRGGGGGGEVIQIKVGGRLERVMQQRGGQPGHQTWLYRRLPTKEGRACGEAPTRGNGVREGRWEWRGFVEMATVESGGTRYGQTRTNVVLSGCFKRRR